MASMRSCWSVSCKYVLYMAAVASLCTGLLVLQRLCMDHSDGDFVTGYCLTDSHMRAILAAILTAIGVVLTSSITSTVEAYRSAKLVSGINEGVYIAMASSNANYRLRALLTRWAPVVMLIVLCTNAPNSVQTLANLGIKTAGVYVRNNSTATVFTGNGSYAATLSATAADYANLFDAMTVLVKMRDYKTSATSTVLGHGEGVTTSVVRDNYLGPLNVYHSDASNALKRMETIVSITSMCSTVRKGGYLSDVVPLDPAAVNVTCALSALNTNAETYIYDILYETLSDNALLIQSSLNLISCTYGNCVVLGPDSYYSSTTTTCTSTLVVQEQDIIYTVGTGSVTPVRLVSNATTVNVSELASAIVGFADSIETTPEGLSNPLYGASILSLYGKFPTGSFTFYQSNVLHTKLCASSALALQILWSNYVPVVSVGDPGTIGNMGNADSKYDVPVPLYNIIQLTYISTADTAIIAGVITVAACVVCIVGVMLSVTSRINIKPATDSSLLYNADAELIAVKQGLSNDPHGQLALEFHPDSMLYCRERVVKYPDPADSTTQSTNCRLNISYSNAGAVPNKFHQYC